LKGGSNITWTTGNHGSTSFTYHPVTENRQGNCSAPEGFFGGGSWHGDNGGVYIWY
jgi:hypothetical protein